MLREALENLLARAGITINGPNPWDMQVHDERLYRRIFRERNLGLGEAYMDGWWDCTALDQFFYRLIRFNVADRVRGGLLYQLRFLPELLFNRQSRSRSHVIAHRHYDRGNDLFLSFLDSRNQYSCGYFAGTDDLETAQAQKLDMICRKLSLAAGLHLLDIGCGWGTLISHAAKYYGVDATGVTIAERQTEFGNQRAKNWGVADRARVLCTDYREIPAQKFDKIVSLEMVEHVGVKNLVSYYETARDLLADEGLFLLQWTGLRRGLRPEDLIWGLFMNKYVFPGADASLCPSPMLKAMEKAGWETHSVENISAHYGITIARWHDNWRSNRDAVVAAYGERWYRIWHFFLGWSAIIAEQGNAACFQVVLHKNLDHYDRTRWIRTDSAILGDRLDGGALQTPASEPTPALNVAATAEAE